MLALIAGTLCMQVSAPLNGSNAPEASRSAPSSSRFGICLDCLLPASVMSAASRGLCVWYGACLALHAANLSLLTKPPFNVPLLCCPCGSGYDCTHHLSCAWFAASNCPLLRLVRPELTCFQRWVFQCPGHCQVGARCLRRLTGEAGMPLGRPAPLSLHKLSKVLLLAHARDTLCRRWQLWAGCTSLGCTPSC